MPPAPPTKPKVKAPPKTPTKPVSKPDKTQHVAKTFSVTPLTGAGEGEKILLYGRSGLGKTTLAAQLPGAVFIPIDDGARKIVNPITRKPVNAITGVDTFDDIRDAVNQSSSLVDKGGCLVIDTITRVQSLVEQWVVDNVKLEKGGQAKNLEAFGFGKGYRHVLDAFRTLLTDFDNLIRSGRNVLLLTQLDQTIVPNPGGADFYQEVPKLIENKQGPCRTEFCEYVDHVLRIGYLDTDVHKAEGDRAGKVSGDASRAVFTGDAQYFLAKSRPVKGEKLPPVVSFEDEQDNSLWSYLFTEK